MRQAFTLFELTMVMVIILVLAGLVSPLAFDALYGDTRLTAASDVVRARWADCRAQAIEEGRPYAFCIIRNTGRFKIEPLDMTDMGGLAVGAESNYGSGRPEGIMIEGALPPGIRFGTSDAAVNPETEESAQGEYELIAVFLPDGSAQEDVDVTFSSGSATAMTLKLRALTGAVTVVRTGQEN